jgi:hypothetical protein
MDKVQRRALGFAVWVILALIVTLLLDSYVPRLRGLGAALSGVAWVDAYSHGLSADTGARCKRKRMVQVEPVS